MIAFIFNTFEIMFSIFPTWFAVAVTVAVGLIVLLLALKLIAFVLDTIPFM